MAIVVIADDLSGAAELAGIAFARGYSAEVQRQRFEPASAAEVIAVDTDSRSLSPEAAADRVREAARPIVAASPAWIFKKVDSLLRGNVRAETESLLAVTGHARAILAPANPSRGRTIAGGSLLIDGVPVDRTDFAVDPEHPRQSANIGELLGRGDLAASYIQSPDVLSLNDLERLANQVADRTLPAGAADFFAALLACRPTQSGIGHVSTSQLSVEPPVLLVCGSRAAWDQRAAQCAAAHVPMWTLPPAGGWPREDLADGPASRLLAAGRLLLGIGPLESSQRPAELVRRLAELTARVLEQAPVKTLLLEGGATAEAVAERLGWRRLAVAAPAPAGIGILRPLETPVSQRVWIKPGSYPWPDAVWPGPQ
jgi:uncharacterized protein YgbK (DUF1537 family)